MNSLSLPARESGGFAPMLLVIVVVFLVLLTGCTSPVGADRVRTHQAYEQVEASALRSGRPSAETVSILHRHGLAALADRRPDQAVRQLHERAVATGERALLFALAELSYSAGEHIRRSVQPWDPRDARDYFLGSAVYAWLYLFGEGPDAPPGPFDRRFRVACDFYNYSLGLALTDRRSTNAAVQLQGARRRLPVGEIEVRLADGEVVSRLGGFEKVLLADQFQVRGLSVRNREPGLGVPLIAVQPLNPEFGIRQSVSVTAFLRGPASLAELAGGQSVCSLELHSIFDGASVAVGATRVPLERDLTTYRAYTMNQSTIWKLGPLQFLAPAERIRSRLIPNQPFDPERIPVVFVHGTFSSPVTWAEMANTLTADPVLRKRYQIWTFIYGSGNPLAQSIAEFRAALKAEVQRLDPSGTNAALRQMVIIGHSQGGLLTKSAVVDTGDRLWRVFSTNRLEDLKITDEERARLRSHLYYEPLPFVRRVVFIATPHRGSYLSGGFARRLAQRVVSLPGAMMARSTELLSMVKGSEVGAFFRGKLPTSLDGMSPKNPGLLVMAELPVPPGVAAHSIIAIKGDDRPPHGADGIVRYSSAHLDDVESEFIVRSRHACLKQPATIEEVRRILREHLATAGTGVNPAPR
jgi:pimeloyl-ACP methyl ester carboxylesterase